MNKQVTRKEIESQRNDVLIVPQSQGAGIRGGRAEQELVLLKGTYQMVRNYSLNTNLRY